MEVAHTRAEKEPTDEAQHRIAEVAVQRGHGAATDAALEAVAHHERMPGAQLLDERVEPGEVVAVVGVAHDDVASARGPDPPPQTPAVPPLGHLHDPCA